MTTEQGGNQAGRSWLAGINSRLASGGELTIKDMKDLLPLRHGLNIKDPMRDLLRTELGKYYFFPPLQSSNDVLEPFKYEDDIAAANDLESYAIDPLQALVEYRDVNWDQELKPYMGSATRGLAISFRFSQFVGGIKSAIVYEAIENLRERVNAEADRILTMSPDEWYKYIGGVRYAQEPYARDIIKNGSKYCDRIEGVTRTHMWGPSSKEQWKELHKRFGQFDTYKDMKKRATVSILGIEREARLEDVITSRYHF